MEVERNTAQSRGGALRSEWGAAGGRGPGRESPGALPVGTTSAKSVAPGKPLSLFGPQLRVYLVLVLRIEVCVS